MTPPLTCNQCSGSLVPKEMNEATRGCSEPYGLIDACVTGGYFSSHLNDMTGYTFSLCEKCLRRMFTSFKIPPTVSDADVEGELTYEADVEAYEKRVWKDSDGPELARQIGICNEDPTCLQKAVWRLLLDDEDEEGVTVLYDTRTILCNEHKACYRNTLNASFKRLAPNSPYGEFGQEPRSAK